MFTILHLHYIFRLSLLSLSFIFKILVIYVAIRFHFSFEYSICPRSLFNILHFILIGKNYVENKIWGFLISDIVLIFILLLSSFSGFSLYHYYLFKSGLGVYQFSMPTHSQKKKLSNNLYIFILKHNSNIVWFIRIIRKNLLEIFAVEIIIVIYS